jgi:hypothetical protein
LISFSINKSESVIQVQYPAITICSPGITDENMEAGFYELVLEFLDANKIDIEGVDAFNASSLLEKVFFG